MVVYYDDAKIFLDNFFTSISQQDTNDFDLLIISDNSSPINYPSLNLNISEIKINHQLTPSAIRREGILHVRKNNYRNLIFSDIDDYFSSNRISSTIRELRNKDFVFNEINLISQNGELIQKNFFKNFFSNKEIQSYKQIIDYNNFGLTNTGIKLKSLKNFYIPSNIVATDWWIFTLLLLNKAIGKFINGAHTFYRQHDYNLVGLKKPLNSFRLDIGLLAKENHYSHICKYCENNKLIKAFKEYKTKKEEIRKLKLALEDRGFRDRYIEVVNSNIERIYRGWWSEILSLNDWEKYES